MSQELKVALVGCGAIAELGHLPGLQLSNRATASALVDPDTERTAKLGSQFSVDTQFQSVKSLNDTLVDAAIVAVPHRLHSEIVVDLLKSGIHVLVEKPIAISSKEAAQMIEAANHYNLKLGVAMVRRFTNRDRFIRSLVTDHALGALQSFRIEDGREFAWPIHSPFLLDAEGGAGVLIGNGSHTFDLLRWWFGEVDSVECELNSSSKQDTDALIELTMKSGVTGVVELSRTRNLSNALELIYDQVKVTIPQVGEATMKSLKGGWGISGFPMANSTGVVSENESLARMMQMQVDNFADAIAGTADLEVDAADGLKTVELIEQCYANAKVSNFDWDKTIEFQSEPSL